MNEFEDLPNSVSRWDWWCSEAKHWQLMTSLTLHPELARKATTFRELTQTIAMQISMTFVKALGEVLMFCIRQVVGKDTDTVTYLVSKNVLALQSMGQTCWSKKKLLLLKRTRAVKGGLLAEFEGASRFIPCFNVGYRFVRNTERFVGQEFDAKTRSGRRNRHLHVVRKLSSQRLQQLALKYCNAGRWWCRNW